MRKLVITIDGPAASGKSTTARLVARRLGYAYLDTGAMYRAMTLKALRAGVDVSNAELLSQLARDTEIDVEVDPDGTRVILDGEDVTDKIREPEVSRNSSAVSAVKAVRERMVELQRKIGAHRGIVAEGRDIGSVVFPNADTKIYLKADLKCRAMRRKKELEAKGKAIELAEVEEDIRARDAYDSGRKHSPLVIPEGAIVVDTTNLTIDQQVTKVIEEVKRKAGEGDFEAAL